jgi:hypothetical protein
MKSSTQAQNQTQRGSLEIIGQCLQTRLFPYKIKTRGILAEFREAGKQPLKFNS